MSSIEKDERLLPLPVVNDLQLNHPHDIPANYSPIYEDEVFGEGRSLRDYFLVVYKRLPIILALTILVTAVVAFYMYRLPSMYEGQTVMVIEPPKAKATQKDSVYINFGYDGNYSNTQLRLLRNPELMRDVVIKLGLHKDPNLFNKGNKGIMDSLRAMFGGEKAGESKDTLPVLTQDSDYTNVIDINTLTAEERSRADQYASMLVGSLNVATENNTDLVNIKLQNTNKDLIPRVTNTLAELHIIADAERAVQGSKGVYQDLSTSIETLKSTIAQQELERIAEMERSKIPVTGDKGADYNAQRLSTLSSQFLEAENERRKIQADFEAAAASIKRGEIYSAASKEGSTYINDARSNILKMKNELDNRIAAIDKQIEDAENKRGQLLVKYTEEVAEVKQVNALLKNLRETKPRLQKEYDTKIDNEEKKLAKNAGSEILTGLQSKLTAAQRREAESRTAYLNAIGVSQNQGVAATKLVTLTNEIDTNRNLYNTYIQRQKEMELTIQGSRPDNMVISTRAMDATLIGPQRNRNIFIAFFLTFAMGIGLAFLLDYLDDSVKTSDDVGKYLGLPTLAIIPHQSLLEKRKKGSLASKAGTTTSTALIAIEDNRSAMAEAYRHLRTSLLFSSAGKPPQTVLVTSSQPSEGKTTTAMNTALTLAQSGADVVIIDCDLRRPRLHSHFEMNNDVGLTNYLSGERNVEILLKPYHAFPKLNVITSGPIPPNPAELLSSVEMKDLLRELKGRFKHIVIDSPPAISFTDAAILATLVDGVILVAMSGKSSIHLIKRFKQRLNSIGARIYGVVLNGIKPDSFEYGYYGYGYDYGYEYDEEDDDSTPKMQNP